MAQAGIAPELIERWHALVSTWGASPAAIDGAFADLVARYGEPHRRYHTLEHIGEVLALVNGGAVELAAWFHDVIYDTRASDSEARSATYAGEVLARLNGPADVIAEVQRLIALTAGHVVDAGDTNGKVLVAADLSILGAEPARYERHARDVRAEYAHVDDDAWRAGRAGVLRSLLELVSDERARSNIVRELAGLASSQT